MITGIFDPFIEKCGVVILDGAMATELEKRGADLNHVLWSAKLLTENPSLIKQVHLDYLQAGADIITTASYQASFPGFSRQGTSPEKATELMILATRLAIQAREEALEKKMIQGPLPLVAASVGPYGASLADGSEYRGDYGLSVEELMSFHRERMRVLSASGADLLAFETIPCPEEAIALIRLLKEFPDAKAWLSFSCKNGSDVCSGSPFAECAALANDSEQVLAVGLNCTAPQFVESLLSIARNVSNKKRIAYPNKGETWDAHHKCWLPASTATDFVQEAIRWRHAGAELIGGCCRSSPEDIKNLKSALCIK
jgi:homocysteine S-methyltransferase